MTTKSRRQWTAEAKLQIIEEARQTAQSVSEVCRRHGIAPGQFYAWEKKTRQGALKALREGRRGRKSSSREVQLETEITRLRAVVSELSAENLELKKGLWP
jgi:transposase-like protein